MNKITTLVLLAFVVGLGLFAKAKLAQEALVQPTVAEPLFEGLDPRRVKGLFIDDVERSVHVKLERVGREWVMTDPLEYPAAPEALRLIFDAVGGNTALPVPEAELESLANDFDPPRALLDVIEEMEDGSKRRSRFELGPLDIDGMSVNVRIRDRIFRTLRNIDTAVKRDVNDFRSKRLFTLDADEIVEVHRTGFEYLPTGSRPLGFDAYRRGTGWRIEHPWRVLGDPDTLALWCTVLNSLSVRSFIRDHDGPLDEFGLDQPHATLELMDRHGAVQKLLFTAQGGTWFFKRDDLPNVYELESSEVAKCLGPPFDFLDVNFTRAFRGEVTEFLIAANAAELRLTHDTRDDRWTVAERPWGADEWSVDVPADEALVSDLLALLEQGRLARYLLDEPASDYFPADAEKRGFWIQYRGERQGGRLGQRITTAQGSEAIPFLRTGDELVGLAPLAFGDLLELEVEKLMSRDLLKLDEIRLSRLLLRADGVQREFRRAQQGTWKYVDMDAAATELYPVLDSIFFLRASEYVKPEAKTTLSDVITIEISGSDGTSIAQIGRSADGRFEAEVLGARSVLENQGLHAQLLEIVRKKQ